MAKAKEIIGSKGNPFDTYLEIVQTMEVPKKYVDDLKWLYYNLKVKNSNHERYDEMMSCLSKLLYLDWRK